MVWNSMEKLCDVSKLFIEANVSRKRRLISLILRDKFTYENLKLRTAKTSELFSAIYLINNGIQRNKKGQINELFDLPNQG